jgi:glyoxylase-like metal-dependent hydrolase (beta-lactamase superfamily II)
MTSETYEVFAVRYATNPRKRRIENVLHHDLHDGPDPMDFFVWVATNATRTVLVDLGGTEAHARTRGHDYLCCPAAGLRRIGIEPERIADAIVTHMHWDHAGNIGLFPNARVHLQAAEMRFATGPHMQHAFLRKPFSVDGVCDMVRRLYDGRLVFHEGAAEIAPGIEVRHVGGHSLGLQVVRVRTARGWVVLASDAAHYYENFRTSNPFPIVVDVAQSLEAFATLTRLAESPDHIVPGHDPLVMTLYPAPAPDLAGFAARLDVDPREAS